MRTTDKKKRQKKHTKPMSSYQSNDTVLSLVETSKQSSKTITGYINFNSIIDTDSVGDLIMDGLQAVENKLFEDDISNGEARHIKYKQKVQLEDANKFLVQDVPRYMCYFDMVLTPGDYTLYVKNPSKVNMHIGVICVLEHMKQSHETFTTKDSTFSHTFSVHNLQNVYV